MTTPKPDGPNGDTGRDPGSGRFLPGNPGGPGNPNARKVAALREALLSAVSAADVTAIVKRLVRDARRGDLAAAHEILDRTLGRAMPPSPEDGVIEPWKLRSDDVFAALCTSVSATVEEARLTLQTTGAKSGDVNVTVR